MNGIPRNPNESRLDYLTRIKKLSNHDLQIPCEDRQSNKGRLDMTVSVRGEFYIITTTKKEIDEGLLVALPQKLQNLIKEAQTSNDGFATSD